MGHCCCLREVEGAAGRALGAALTRRDGELLGAVLTVGAALSPAEADPSNR